MKTEDIHTLEWSRDQNCFHIDTLDRVIEKNIEVALGDAYNGDWKIIGAYDSPENARLAMHMFRAAMGEPDFSFK